uniref:Uncharacterized protein n=1 Tax=Ditylenchus dipsaci TaxID=166011 RepID=A0A915EGJ2_9BILA
MEKVVELCFMPLTPPALLVSNNQTNSKDYCASNRTSALSSSIASSPESHSHHTNIHLLVLFACLMGWLAWTLLKRFAVHHTSYWQRLGCPVLRLSHLWAT